MDHFIPSQGLLDTLETLLISVTDYTDVTGKVSIVTVDFVEGKGIDPTGIPGDTATFAVKTSSAVPVVVPTPETGGDSLVWPDPAGGWTFVSLQASPSGFAYGYRVDGTAGEFVGCRKFPAAIPVTAAGAYLYVGEIRLPIKLDNVFDEGIMPG